MLIVTLLPAMDFGTEGEKTKEFFDNENNPVSGGPVEFPGGEGFDTSYYFKVGRNVPISEAYFNISTYNSHVGMAPEKPYVDVGVDSNKEWQYEGTGYGKFGQQKYFSDDKTQVSISYGSSGGSDNSNKVLLPRNAEIIDADIGVRGRFQDPSNIPISTYTIQEDPSELSMDGYAMEKGDIDDDGDIDVIVSDIRNDRIVWIENKGDNISEWKLHDIYDGYDTTNTYSIDVDDIDGDGDLDVAATSYSRGYVMWFRNNNDGDSWSRYRFKTGFSYAGRVRIADMDQDGNPDIVVASYYNYLYYRDEFLYWFEAPDNPSTTSGWKSHQIASSPYYYMYSYLGMDVGYLNDDDYPDIVLSTYPRYSYYGNNHLHTYTNPKSTSGSWSHKVIDSGANQIHSLEVADMDDDGDDDIITATYGQNYVKLYDNINNASSWSENNLISFTRPRYVLAEDMNDDGKLDILVGGGSGIYDFSVLHQGSNHKSYTEHVITSELIDPMAFVPFDKDNDNDLDAMVAGTSGSQLVIVNTTDESTPSHEIIWLADGGVKDIRGMDYHDMDGDGDLDVIFCAYGTGYIGWMENDGTPFNKAGKLYKIGSVGNPIEIMAADIDGDDDKDVAVLSSGGVAVWYENTGAIYSGWPSSVIASGIPSAYAMYAGDFTGDGKADLVTSSARGYRNGEVRLYKSPSNPKTSWPMNRIASSISYQKRIWAEDMDLDGDLDVLSVNGAYGSGNAVYYRNPSPGDPMGGTWGAVSIGGGLYYPEDIKAIDITDDGYPDAVVTGTYYYSKAMWYQSPYGDQVNSWTAYTLYSSAYTWRLAVGDIGNDGYADIILNRGSTSSPSSIYWFEEGVDYTQSWNSRSLGGYSGTWALGIADLEGDDVHEIMSTSRSRDEIRAYRLNAVFPSGIGLDIGSDSSSDDWENQGTLKGEKKVDISSFLQSTIDTEPSSTSLIEDSWGTTMLSIPLELSSGSSGRVQMEDIYINYNATVRIDQDGSGKSLKDVLNRLIPDYVGEDDSKLRVYIGVGAQSEGMAYISDLNVEYNAIPRQSQEMEELRLREDEKKVFDFNLRDYFRDDYTPPNELEIDVRLSGRKWDMIEASVVDGELTIDASVTPNFYTRMSEPYDVYAEFIVTDDGGPNNVPARTYMTKRFPVIVEPVNDDPVATGQSLPDLYAWEGKTTVVVDLDDYELFTDVDNDPILYDIVYPDRQDIPGYNESADLEIDLIGSEIQVSLNELSDWTGTIPLTIYGTDDHQYNIYTTPRIKTNIIVNNTNDPPKWMDIPTYTVIEDTPMDRIVELTQFVDDIDSPLNDMTVTIEEYTNQSFVTFSMEYLQSNQAYLNFEPRVKNWNGMSTITITISDGEFMATTEFDVEVLPINDPPSITILEPNENQRIEPGPFSIVGETRDVEGVLWVEVLFQDEWVKAIGKNNWGLTLEAPRYNEMKEDIPIQVRAYDGENYTYAYVNITILKYLPPELFDSDNDGYDDIMDDFPFNPSEWKDTDRDGVGDNEDVWPENPAWKYDHDKDGFADAADTHDYDPELWNDNNGDGRNDDEPVRNNNQITTEDEEANWFWPIFLFVLSVVFAILAILSLSAFLIKRSAAKDPRKMARFYKFEQKWRDRQNALIEKSPFASMSGKVSDTVSQAGPRPMPSMSGPSPVRSLPGGHPGMRRPGLPPGRPPIQQGNMKPPSNLNR